MSVNKNQSAIQEVKDQLFLDSADGVRLNVVTDNLGLDRPVVGVSDDTWRAISRKIALKRKIVRNSFEAVLSACLGPKTSRAAVLAEAAAVGDTTITVTDTHDLLQLGTLVLSSGTVDEETVNYCFLDPATNKVYLTSALANAHTPVAYGNKNLTADAAVSATSLVVADSLAFPTTGFPYNVIIDRGTEFEEIVEVSANTTATNTLTCAATTFAHSGPNTPTVRKPLERAAPAGRTFLVLDVNDTRVFPKSGWLRIDFGGGSEEVAEFIDNDTTNDILYLKRPLENAHAVGESVELMEPGATVETLNALQQGAGWELYNTSPRNVQIFIPTNAVNLRITDASWLHKTTPGTAGSTTTTAGVSPGDTELPVTSVRGFVDEADIIDIDTGTEETFYIKRESGGPVELSVASEPFALSDGETLLVSVDGAAAATATFNTADFVSIAAATAVEVAEVINTDVANCHADATSDGKVRITSDAWPADATASIEVTGGTANPELDFDTPTLILAEGLANSHLSGVAVNAVQVNYGGTSLEEGNLRDALGAVIENRFPGPYLYDRVSRGPSEITTTLNETLATPTRVAVSQVAGAKCLEVRDVFDWPAPAFTPFEVRVGAGSGFSEDVLVTDRTLKEDAATTLDSGATAGDNSITGVDTTAFPESNGVNLAGYRLILDRGNAGEEVVTVLQNTAGAPGTFTLVSTLVKNHSAGVTIELLNDVLTVDPLQEPHQGDAVNPSREGHTVAPIVNSIDLVSATSFPSEGWLWLNFGKERISVRDKIVSVVSPTVLEFADTSIFPTTDFPYKITVGEGLPQETRVTVSANDTGTDRLTLSSALAHEVNQAWQIDDPAGAPVFVDETVDFRDAGADDVDPWPASEAVGDQFAIGFARPFSAMTIDVGTAGTVGTLTWKYWDGTAWSNLTGVTDGTTGFTTAGSNTVTFTIPADWTARTLSTSDSLYYVVAEVATVYTVNPILTSGSIVGVVAGDYVEFKSGTPTTVNYNDKDIDTLELTTPQPLPSGYTEGETVMLSPSISIPDPDGYDYAFLLPPDPSACVKFVIDLVRAAGVLVEFISDN